MDFIEQPLQRALIFTHATTGVQTVCWQSTVIVGLIKKISRDILRLFQGLYSQSRSIEGVFRGPEVIDQGGVPLATWSGGLAIWPGRPHDTASKH